MNAKKVTTCDDGIGFVQYVDAMGSDLSVVNAARVSYEKTSSWDEDPATSVPQWGVLKQSDAKLISYLAKHNHWTPFGHVQVSMRFKAPIFVARQLVKHQVGLVWNEVSRRYVKDTPEFYYPSNLHKAPEKSKQGASDEQFPNAADALLLMRDMTQATLAVYEGLIEEGLAPEEARIVLPLNTYTEWLWTGSLAAWARVHHLRADPHTQSATRRYAVAVDEIMKEIVPVSWDALTRKEAHDN